MSKKIIKIIIGITLSIVVPYIMFGDLFLYEINPLIPFFVLIVFSILFGIFFIKSSNLNIFFIKIIFSLGISFLVLSICVLIYNNFYISEYSWKEIPNIKAIYSEIGTFIIAIIFLFFGFYLLRLYKQKLKFLSNLQKEEQLHKNI